MGGDERPTALTAFTLNGEAVIASESRSTRLSDVLRRGFDRIDVRNGCNAGDCGACTVLIDDAPACACLVPLGQVQDARVDTVHGLLATDAVARTLRDRFAAEEAAQCGICTPGMLVAATALVREHPSPSLDQAKDALGGVLCRCTGYGAILRAVCGADAVGSVTLDSTASRRTPATPTIGAPLRRLDGASRLDGSVRFGDDVAPSDALILVHVRSPHHRAAFVFGDLERFVQAHGLAAVLSARDVPGTNLHGVIPGFVDQPVFAEHEARFRGEAVAAVVGTQDAVMRALQAGFPIEWTERVPRLSIEARPGDGDPVHAERADHRLCRGSVRRGDAEAALNAAAHRVTRRVRTGFVEHSPIEPEAGYAIRVGDRLEVHGCTQAPYMDRDAVAAILGIAPDAVRVVPSACGGGFGTKLDLSWQPAVAVAAWHLGQAVRVTLTRAESIATTTKRHPAALEVDIGCDADGRLTGMRFRGRFDTGAYASWGPTVANRVPVHGSGPYRVPHYDAEAIGLHTHAAPAGAFRGFGVPQSAICQEGALDELADRVGLDRLAFRRLNALRDGEPTVTGQRFTSGVGIDACLAALDAPWTAAVERRNRFNADVSEASDLRYGIAIASGWYGCGNTSLPNPSTLRCGIRADGAVVLHQGAVDIGQGSNTVITQIFAATLGIDPTRVVLVGADTDRTPDAGKTSASRQTLVSGNAARATAFALRAALARLTNSPPDAPLDAGDDGLWIGRGSAHEQRLPLERLVPDADGYVVSACESWDPPTAPLDADGQGSPYAQYGYAAQLVELVVDTRHGTVRLERLVAAHDVGRAINVDLVRGQIEGGVAQGIGLALMEEFLPGRTENLHDYLIPTIGDIPPIEAIVVEVEDAIGPFGAKGLGEHVLIPTAAAILNAIRDATGVTLERVPATPDRVRAAILARAAAGVTAHAGSKGVS